MPPILPVTSSARKLLAFRQNAADLGGDEDAFALLGNGAAFDDDEPSGEEAYQREIFGDLASVISSSGRDTQFYADHDLTSGNELSPEELAVRQACYEAGIDPDVAVATGVWEDIESGIAGKGFYTLEEEQSLPRWFEPPSIDAAYDYGEDEFSCLAPENLDQSDVNVDPVTGEVTPKTEEDKSVDALMNSNPDYLSLNGVDQMVNAAIKTDITPTSDFNSAATEPAAANLSLTAENAAPTTTPETSSPEPAPEESAATPASSPAQVPIQPKPLYQMAGGPAP